MSWPPSGYGAGEVDRETLDRSIASYRGILKHFNSYGLRQDLNALYKREVKDNASGTDD